MTKLRVAMVTRFPYTEAEGYSGLVQVSLRLCNALAKRPDVELHVVTLSEKIIRAEQQERDGYAVTFLPRGSGIAYYGSLCLSASLAVRQCLRRLRPDVVHAQALPETVVGSLLSGLPNVTTIHGVYRYETLSEGSSLEARIARRVIILNEAWYARRLKYVISCSPYVTRFVQHQNQSAVFFDISNPIDPSFFAVDLKQTTPRSRTILLLGSISYRKGHDLMVEALAQLVNDFPDVELTIVGNEIDAAFAQVVRQKIDELNLSSRIRWLGATPQEELIAEMKRHQIVCLPSRGETLPMALSQAMAVGNICVASDAGGIPDMIQDGVNGFLFPADNAPALAEKLATVMKMPGAVLESIRLRNRAFAEKTYYPESVAEQTVAAYRTLIQRSSSL